MLTRTPKAALAAFAFSQNSYCMLVCLRATADAMQRAAEYHRMGEYRVAELAAKHADDWLAEAIAWASR